MKTTVILTILLSCTMARADIGSQVVADGLIQFDPPQAVSCVAVRVEVPEDKMVTGIRWYNGNGTNAFPQVLVASGSGFAPPAFTEAVVIAQNVQGNESGWSELEFSEPVASQSGTLFILMQYPENYTPPETGTALGVGYATAKSTSHFFVTGDGETWLKVSMECQVLLEPVLAARLPGVLEKSKQETREGELPAHKIGLFVGPNPFNPAAIIKLYLPESTSGSVKVFDIRGRLVVELHNGVLAKGENNFIWTGRDSKGRGQASGAYYVKAEAGEQTWTHKLMLIK
jgi:hypothetical protein